MQYKRKVDNKMKWYGNTDTKKKVIRINKKKSKRAGKGELIDSIMHEEVHAKHPRMKEKSVERKTTRVVKAASRKKKARLYKRYER
jgi:hypothetical protein